MRERGGIYGVHQQIGIGNAEDGQITIPQGDLLFLGPVSSGNEGEYPVGRRRGPARRETAGGWAGAGHGTQKLYPAPIWKTIPSV